jgi:ubiquinone/menaquinone biosynthesis C-methylase UbiE
MYSHYLHTKGHQVTGIDLQSKFVKTNAKQYPEIPFIQGSAEKLPFTTNQFDTVVLFDVLEHIDDQKALKQAFKVGKRVIISVPHTVQPILRKYSLVHHHYLDQTHQRTYTPTILRNMLKKQKWYASAMGLCQSVCQDFLSHIFPKAANSNN